MIIPPQQRNDQISIMSPFQIDEGECKKIIDLHEDPKNFHRKGKVQDQKGSVVDLNMRETDIYVIDESFKWIDNLLCEAAFEANKLFQFNISGILERPQLLHYTAPSNGYDWHLDVGNGDQSCRKISISILLNNNYVGGDLSFFMDGEDTIDAEMGSAVCFPSFVPHKVNPLTEGERWSLVCWIAGDPFR